MTRPCPGRATRTSPLSRTRLQRDWEVTELVVRLRPKAVEWAEIGQRLAEVTKDGDHA